MEICVPVPRHGPNERIAINRTNDLIAHTFTHTLNIFRTRLHLHESAGRSYVRLQNSARKEKPKSRR